jgi:hypothetical protein
MLFTYDFVDYGNMKYRKVSITLDLVSSFLHSCFHITDCSHLMLFPWATKKGYAASKPTETTMDSPM